MPLSPPHHLCIKVALLKLYKEYTDSAFSLWKGGKAQTVADYVAAGPDAKGALKAFLEAHKEVRAIVI